jgi:hypothetical protein
MFSGRKGFMKRSRRTKGGFVYESDRQGDQISRRHHCEKFIAAMKAGDQDLELDVHQDNVGFSY